MLSPSSKCKNVLKFKKKNIIVLIYDKLFTGLIPIQDLKLWYKRQLLHDKHLRCWILYKIVCRDKTFRGGEADTDLIQNLHRCDTQFQAPKVKIQDANT